MTTKIKPIFVTEVDCVEWSPTTLRDRGKDEAFLEKVISENPQLLALEDLRTHVAGKYVAFRQLRLTTPQGRYVKPDIIFLTGSGHVVIVEVKLSDNDELGDRRVVAQVLDYAASLAAYTEREIASLFTDNDGDSFVEVVRSRFPETEQADELAAILLEKMRRAELHLIIACDGAPDGLREFVRGVTNQSATGGYELRVVELLPYINAGHAGLMLLPSVPIRTEIVSRMAVNITYSEGEPKPGVEVVVSSQEEIEEAIRRAQSGTEREINPAMAATVAAYDAIAEPGLKTRGRAATYRQIRPDAWPNLLHYELLANSKGVSVELHLESDELRPLNSVLELLATKLRSKYPNAAWDPKWSKGRGRLVLGQQGAEPSIAAETMKIFIAETRSIVDNALSKLPRD